MTYTSPHLTTDFYKTSHIDQYPPDTTMVYSNFTPRSTKHATILPEVGDDKIVVFGIQAFVQSFLIDHWNEQFFKRPADQVCAQYVDMLRETVNPNATADQFAALHALGYLPITIKALPEGTVVRPGVPVLTICNTHNDFGWLPNYLETAISAELWKPMTTATIARQYRKLINHFAKKTGAAEWFADWQCHDFSMRGMSGIDDAARSGAGHLLSFFGTDTIPAVQFLKRWYGGSGLIGGSVPATEHSVMCMGTKSGELDTFRRLVTEVYPSGIVSIVSDTWNLWTVLMEYAPALRTEIMSREGKVVFRPDSGDPVDIICGTDQTQAGSTPEEKGVIQLLWETFGGTTNALGFKTLDPHVGAIYGDSITLDRAKRILERLEAKGFASDNIVFGIGSYTYQMITRDTYGFAMKATAGIVGDEYLEIFKDPITDDGTKRSARGLLRVYIDESDEYTLADQQTRLSESGGCLEVIFHNGRVERTTTLEQIRARIKQTM